MMIKMKQFIKILKNNKKRINIFLTIIIIFNFFLAIEFFSREEAVIRVNAENRKMIMNMLDEYKKNRDTNVFWKKIFTVKVGIGNGFHCGTLHLYYPIGSEIIHYGEGDFWLGQVGHYVRENGILLEYISLFILKINLMLFILKVVLKKTIFKEDKYERED